MISVRRLLGLAAIASVAIACLFDARTARADEPSHFLEGADEPAAKQKGDVWDATIWARARMNAMRGFPLDETGKPSTQRYFLESRLRLGGGWMPRKEFEVHAEMDIASGIVVGNTTKLGTGPGEETLRYRLDKQLGLGPIDVRQLYFLLRTPVGELRFGRQAASWGLGMIANDGAGEPDFGDRRYGDLDYRLSLTSKPLAWAKRAPAWVRELTLFAAADFVYKDETADQPSGDTAFQGFFGLRTLTESLSAGVLEFIRYQKDRAEPGKKSTEHTQITAATTDVWLSVLFARAGSGSFRLEGEGAVTIGNTNRLVVDKTKDAAIRALGGLVRLRYDNPELRLTVKSEIGYASGDNNARDGVMQSFSFDPDYRVGLLMFDQVLARMSARAADRFTDDAVLAATRGARFIPTQGAVTNAVYVNPAARFRPLPGVDLRLGYLLGWSAEDLVDPYNSAKRGLNTTYGGKSPGSRALGHEGNLSARYRVRLYRDLAVRVGAEGALFFPGAAFEGVPGIGIVWLARGLVDFTW